MRQCHVSNTAGLIYSAKIPSLSTAIGRILNILTKNPNILAIREKNKTTPYHVQPHDGLQVYSIKPCVQHSEHKTNNQRHNSDAYYVSLDDANIYIRSLFDVRKRYHYNRGSRPTLKDFVMPDNSRYAIACVNHEYLYVSPDRYYGTVDSSNEIIEVWTIRGFKMPQYKYYSASELQDILDSAAMQRKKG